MDAIHGVLHRGQCEHIFSCCIFQKAQRMDGADHCINHLRQMIMCNADITPIPTRWYGGINQNYIDSNRPHTCRNFGKLRAWVSERYNGSLAVPSQSAPEGVNDELKHEQ